MLAEPGFHTRAFVEWEDWPRAVLIAAQRAGYFAPAPIWDDLRSFNARPFRGAFDTVLAGYPCQPFSAAGKRGGAADPRHLWPEVARVIRECVPEWVFLENVSSHVTPNLAPALGFHDCLTWARRLAADSQSPGTAAAQSALCRMADGMAYRARALRLLSNGVHPLAAAHAWRSLASAHGHGPLDLAAYGWDGRPSADDSV
jgi:site-specific DNA-cytosine methylase